MKKLIQILKKYGYKVSNVPLHKKNDLNKYRSKKDAVSSATHLSFFSPAGHLIGRIFHKKSTNDKLSQSDIDLVTGFFTSFQIPHNTNIIKELKHIYEM